MKLRNTKMIELIESESYNELFKAIDSHIYNKGSYKLMFNSILFKDSDIALEYIISTHKSIFFNYIDYIQDKGIHVYFSDKCLSLLAELEDRKELLI